MCRIICVSNRLLCDSDFIARIRSIIDCGIPVILREKDLSEEEYYNLLCRINRKTIIAHTFIAAAKQFGCTGLHLPLHMLKANDASDFEVLGVSTHSLYEAMEAERLGTSYITLGHIYPTDCKKGVPHKGIGLITDVKNAVAVPIYAIGGISHKNALPTIKAGAYGVCSMSGFMKCEDAAEYAAVYKHILKGTK